MSHLADAVSIDFGVHDAAHTNFQRLAYNIIPSQITDDVAMATTAPSGMNTQLRCP